MFRRLCGQSEKSADTRDIATHKWIIRKPGDPLPTCQDCGRTGLTVNARKQWPRHYYTHVPNRG